MINKNNLLTIGFMITIIFIAIFAELYIKNKVLLLERQISEMSDNIIMEKEEIHALAAEWQYLIRPARIEKLALKHLQLIPMLIAQVNDGVNIVDNTYYVNDTSNKVEKEIATIQPVYSNFSMLTIENFTE